MSIQSDKQIDWHGGKAFGAGNFFLTMALARAVKASAYLVRRR
jgi:hypothetical protein